MERTTMIHDPVTGEILDLSDSEKLVITTGGLYSALPIPAYRVLVNAKKHVAKDVLLCIVSHLGYANRGAYPSYSLISKETGRSRSGIRPALDVLEDFGFLKVFKFREGKKDRNIYHVQQACYMTSRMSEKARGHLPNVRFCQECGKGMAMGEFRVIDDYVAHWGCSGMPTKPRAKSKSPMGGNGSSEATSTRAVANG
jgi:hypothetical protein